MDALNPFLLSKGLRSKVGKCIQSTFGETAVLLVIMANTVYMSWQTDWMVKQLQQPSGDEIRALELFFTLFFCVDILLRIYVERLHFFIGRNVGWNMLDLLVVITALTEEVLNLISASGGSTVSSTKVIRVLRILRLIRIVRFIRGAKFFTELRALCLGVFQTMGSLFWAICLLSINIFVFSIYLTQGVAFHFIEEQNGTPGYLTSEESKEILTKNIGSLIGTMYTLWKAISGGADWEVVGDALFEISTVMGCIFVFYIAFAVCAMLNVVTGIFVNKAIQVAESDLDMMLLSSTASRKESAKQMREVFRKADQDGDQRLNRSEFAAYFDHPCVKAFFEGLDLDLQGTTTDQLFDLLDFSGDGMLTLHEFIYGLQSMKGNARSLNLSQVHMTLNNATMSLSRKVGEVSQIQKELSAEVALQHGDLRALWEEMIKIFSDLTAKNPKEQHSLPEESKRVAAVETADIDLQNANESFCLELHSFEGGEMLEVFFGEEVKTLGFEIEWKMPKPTVGSVNPQGAAEEVGIQAGDYLIKVNDYVTGGQCREELLPCFQERPLTLQVFRAHAGSATASTG
eukprot:gnl/MRDRNA2_/MRDRNA2_65546_c0_seq1.p1 gnl/MRDRNA2_/MRDRNA2_65546_c0~~gnl/MRDRNA2_/MRDRNA2_65546_c0_seq1.p1  ORF type:complete len:592 (+),score=109.03 gnl/MRDRNA2_/MRDRNA2_65546_c0_seq1:62-1777(+)